MNEQIKAFIESLGEPTEDNGYMVFPIDGVWWIQHWHVSSGEPLEQMLNEFFGEKLCT